ncbi:hypothetical protein C8R44DRAFT_742698 [Mycena epipterygia]|nr:hypothetical protein C8R44DRAFT_742698 [Mycena epipterygia]
MQDCKERVMASARSQSRWRPRLHAFGTNAHLRSDPSRHAVSPKLEPPELTTTGKTQCTPATTPASTRMICYARQREEPARAHGVKSRAHRAYAGSLHASFQAEIVHPIVVPCGRRAHVSSVDVRTEMLFKTLRGGRDTTGGLTIGKSRGLDDGAVWALGPMEKPPEEIKSVSYVKPGSLVAHAHFGEEDKGRTYFLTSRSQTMRMKRYYGVRCAR